MVTVFYDAALIMFQEIKEDYAKSLNHYEMALGAIIKLLPGKWIHLRLWLLQSIAFVACFLLAFLPQDIIMWDSIMLYEVFFFFFFVVIVQFSHKKFYLMMWHNQLHKI